MKFNERLIYLRKNTGYDQAKTANIIGIARSTYGSYEQGKRSPDYDILINIADLFDVSTDYLLCRTDNNKNAREFLSDFEKKALNFFVERENRWFKRNSTNLDEFLIYVDVLYTAYMKIKEIKINKDEGK